MWVFGLQLKRGLLFSLSPRGQDGVSTIVKYFLYIRSTTDADELRGPTQKFEK